MKHKYLRAYLKRRFETTDYEITGELVIDAKSFLRYTYADSGYDCILGGEYDRYADYLRSKLARFKNITCYVIYNAANASTEIAPRLEWHQKNVDNAYHILRNEKYTDVTIFHNDVCKAVLDEHGMKVLTYETPKEAIITLAKQKECPVLTTNFELCLYGISCVTPNSLRYDENTNCLTSDIYTAENIKKYLKIHPTLIGTFLTFADEESPAFAAIPRLTKCSAQRVISYLGNLLRWIQRKTNKKDVLSAVSRHVSSEDYDLIVKSINEHDKIYNLIDEFAYDYFTKKSIQDLIDADDWLTTGVANGIISVPFVNLQRYGYYSGSWLVADHEKEDAMLPALNIVFFAQALLTQSKRDKITFIGRRGDFSAAWEINRNLELCLPERAIFRSTTLDMFKYFLKLELPGFQFSLLRDVPEECWIVIISLIYYLEHKVAEKKNMALAYAVLFSYVMVGPVTEEVGIIKRSLIFRNINSSDTYTEFGLNRRDCHHAAVALTPWFYIEDIEAVFDRSLLHVLSEYQHCLQNMEYLNKLTGSRVSGTKFHKVYNGTFIYNAMLLFNSSPDPAEVVKSRLGSTTVFRFFEKVFNTFETCLFSVKK